MLITRTGAQAERTTAAAPMGESNLKVNRSLVAFGVELRGQLLHGRVGDPGRIGKHRKPVSAERPVGEQVDQREVEPLGSAHHHVHLNRRAQRQGGDADRSACRVGLGEVLAVRLTHHREIGYISQVDADSEHVS